VSPLETAGLATFIVILFIGLYSILFGFPGTLLIVLDVVVFSWITGFNTIGFTIIVVLFFISLIAETIDFLLGTASGVRRMGLSMKGFFISIIGSIIGAALLTPVLFGLGTIAGIFLGGFTGLLISGYMDDRAVKPSFRSGVKALLQQYVGTFVKGLLAIAMMILSLSAIYS